MKKKSFNKYDNQLPEIDVKPNTDFGKTIILPKIIYEGSKSFTENDRRNLTRRLNFINPKDLLGLSYIRIVNDINSHYGKTIGCYYAKNKSRDAEILLGQDLFGPLRKALSTFEKFIYKDSLLETLYHEIGHHKAATTHSISKYKGEAFAEKYMLAYKKAWFRENSPSKIGIVITDFLRSIAKVIAKPISYLLRNKSVIAKLFYQYLNEELNYEDFRTKVDLVFENKQRNKKKVHPLNKVEYRKKFQIKR